MNWPLQALSYIIQTKINNEWIDKAKFYEWLFYLYKEKMNFIQESPLFFIKFVEVFVKLSLYDNLDKNFAGTLNQFKEIVIESNGVDALVHARFLAKYFTYLYEDSFELIIGSKLSYKKEGILKREHSKDFINFFKNVLDLSYFENQPDQIKEICANEPIDDLVFGITWIYIFRSDILSWDDIEIMINLPRYKDINVCIRSLNKLIEFNLIDEKGLSKVVKLYEEIYDAEVSENTLEWMTEMFTEIVKNSFDLNMDENDQQRIIEFVYKVAQNTERKYKSISYTFEALGGYVRMAYKNQEALTDSCK